jgi:SsrA-binding protein
MSEDGEKKKIIASNRKARYEYEIIDTFEAGMALLGTEVKALREGKASLGDAYADIRRGEVYLINAHIGAYEQAGRANAPPLR